jgi:hypothetical protein
MLWSQKKCTPTIEDNVYAKTDYNERRIHTRKNNTMEIYKEKNIHLGKKPNIISIN